MQPQIDRLMEVLIMKRFWRKQLPAALLALVLMISLVPAVGAVAEHDHVAATSWTKNE